MVIVACTSNGTGREVDQDKLPDLLEIKYGSTPDAVAALGRVAVIRDVFVGFQESYMCRWSTEGRGEPRLHCQWNP